MSSDLQSFQSADIDLVTTLDAEFEEGPAPTSPAYSPLSPSLFGAGVGPAVAAVSRKRSRTVDLEASSSSEDSDNDLPSPPVLKRSRTVDLAASSSSSSSEDSDLEDALPQEKAEIKRARAAMSLVVSNLYLNKFTTALKK